MFKTFTYVAASAAVLATGLWAQEETPDHRLRTAADVFHEVTAAPDKGIPRDLLEKAQCVVIVPGLKKAAFLVGGDYGRGYALCRHAGGWSGPAAIKFGGGSFGAQIGAESTDVVMLVMDRKGMEKLAGRQVHRWRGCFGGRGPSGPDLPQPIPMRRCMLRFSSWSRAHGAFAGVSLDGTVVKKDGGEDQKLYGMDESNRGHPARRSSSSGSVLAF